MGVNRNGARSYLDVIQKACKLSRLPGFRTGLTRILGTGNSAALFDAWEPFCLIVDGIIAGDDYFNRKDHIDTDSSGEDTEET
jgi:hypothetical protein